MFKPYPQALRARRHHGPDPENPRRMFKPYPLALRAHSLRTRPRNQACRMFKPYPLALLGRSEGASAVALMRSDV